MVSTDLNATSPCRWTPVASQLLSCTLPDTHSSCDQQR